MKVIHREKLLCLELFMALASLSKSQEPSTFPSSPGLARALSPLLSSTMEVKSALVALPCYC
jgi:hypothetical protein